MAPQEPRRGRLECSKYDGDACAATSLFAGPRPSWCARRDRASHLRVGTPRARSGAHALRTTSRVLFRLLAYAWDGNDGDGVGLDGDGHGVATARPPGLE